MTNLLRAAVWFGACFGSALFVFLGTRRLFYPLELDYIEGVMMDHVVRLSQGQPIYVQPSLAFIPLAYMPLFASVASLIARVSEPDFWQIRILSLVSMIAISILVLRIVSLETRSRTLGLGAAGILLMAFGVTGGHYDVGRPDSMMLLLVVAGLATLRFTHGPWGAAGSAVLLALAFFTKQHAAWFGLAALVHLALNDRRRLMWFAPLLILASAGGYALLASWLGPWFTFFTWDVPRHWSHVDRVRIVAYVGHGLFGTLGALSIPTVLSLSLPERPWRGAAGIWMWAGLGGVCTGLMATLDPDAFRHVLNPTVVALSILGPISLSRIGERIAAGTSRLAAHAVPFALMAMQFIPLVYPLRGQVPRQNAAEAHRVLIERLRQPETPVLMLYHGFYGWQAGKGSSLHQIALDDVIRAEGNQLLRRDPEFFDRMFEGLRRGPGRPTIVTDIELERSGLESRALWASLRGSYRLEGDLGWISSSLNPVTGSHWTPRFVYVPIDQPGTSRAGGKRRPAVSAGASRAAVPVPSAVVLPLHRRTP